MKPNVKIAAILYSVWVLLVFATKLFIKSGHSFLGNSIAQIAEIQSAADLLINF